MNKHRALFTLHQHILDQAAQPVTAKFKPLDEWRSGSQAALDTITKMVVDISDSHNNMSADELELLPPSFSYAILSALRHIEIKKPVADPWLQEAEERLRAALWRFDRCWGVGGRRI